MNKKIEENDTLDKIKPPRLTMLFIDICWIALYGFIIGLILILIACLFVAISGVEYTDNLIKICMIIGCCISLILLIKFRIWVKKDAEEQAKNHHGTTGTPAIDAELGLIEKKDPSDKINQLLK